MCCTYQYDIFMSNNEICMQTFSLTNHNSSITFVLQFNLNVCALCAYQIGGLSVNNLNFGLFLLLFEQDLDHGASVVLIIVMRNVLYFCSHFEAWKPQSHWALNTVLKKKKKLYNLHFMFKGLHGVTCWWTVPFNN